MSAASRCRAMLAALALAPALGLAFGCGAEGGAAAPAELVELSGDAFGTTWHVRFRARAAQPAPAELAVDVRDVLDLVDARMSTWRDDSELSRFNRSASDDWWPVSTETAAVVATALDVHRRSQGAFDPTVAPLVALWGFGPGRTRARPPEAAQVEALLPRLGADGIAVRAEPAALRKARPWLSLDLSGVAKGFAVDAVARRLAAQGVEDFLVEVGGELRARGAAPGGGAWRVGIERPEPGARRIGWVVGLADAGLATSGDYRRYFEWQGRRYSHVIDPRSGYPVEHDLVSVSVLAPEAAYADAWATALLVLGPEAGWRVAEREGLAVLFVRGRDERLEVRATPAMERRRLRW